MASQLHRRAALSSALRAINKNHETVLNSMQPKTTEEATSIDQRPTVYPVVVGDRSLFKSPRDLALFLGEDDFYYDPTTVFELTNNTDLKLPIDPDRAFEILLKADLPNLFVCGVGGFTASNLGILTKGTRPLIWFEGKCRAAWLPTSLQEINQALGTCESGAAKNVPTEGELLILVGDLGSDRSVFKTVEELWNFLDPTTVNCDKSCPGKPGPHYHHYPSGLVACVDKKQYRRVEVNTTGERCLVWFPDNVARYAWVPHATVFDDRSKDHGSDECYSKGSSDKTDDMATNPEEGLMEVEVEGVMNDEDHEVANEDEAEENEEILELMRMKAVKSERRAKEGNWQEAARRAMLPQSPKLDPVIVGERSLFKTYWDISSWLGLTNDCSTSTAFEIPLDLDLKICNRRESGADLVASHSETLTSVQVSGVHYSDLRDIQALTQCEDISIWFQGQVRTAFVPKSFRDVTQHLNGYDLTSNPTITGDCSFPIIIGTRNHPANMVEGADDLARYFDLPETPSVVPTIETYIKTDESWRFRYREPHCIRYAPECVSFVTRAQRCELEARSYGETRLVWFPDKTCRQAWHAWQARPPEIDEENGEAQGYGSEEMEAKEDDGDENSNQDSSKSMGETGALDCEASTLHNEESPTANTRETSATAHSASSEDSPKVNEKDESESMGSGLCPWIKDTYKRIMRKFGRG